MGGATSSRSRDGRPTRCTRAKATCWNCARRASCAWTWTLAEAPNGQVITEVTHTGARDAAYRNTFKSIPSDRRFRLPLDEAHWPRIPGHA